MNCKCNHLILSLAAGGLLLLGLFLWLDATSQIARADPGNLFVKPDGTGTACTQAQPCTLQPALVSSSWPVPNWLIVACAPS